MRGAKWKLAALGQTPKLQKGAPQGRRELWPDKDTSRNTKVESFLKAEATCWSTGQRSANEFAWSASPGRVRLTSPVSEGSRTIMLHENIWRREAGDYSLLLAIKTFSGKSDLSHNHKAHQPTDPDAGLITLYPSVTCSDNLNPASAVWSS